MYNRIGYKYFLLSIVAHAAILLGIAVYLPPAENRIDVSRLDRKDKIKIKLYETPKEDPQLTVKKEVFLPEKKVLDFSDIPPGKKPEKAPVYGKVSREASTDQYENKSDKVQHSETVAALPKSRRKMQQPAPSVDAGIRREFSLPVKILRPARQVRPSPGRESAEIKEKNLYARLQPSEGKAKEAKEEKSEEVKEKIREPRILVRETGIEDVLQKDKLFEAIIRKPEISASRGLGGDLGPMDRTDIELSLNKLEQAPDIITDNLGKHASIKNSAKNTSNADQVKVISLDTHELKYISYFHHIKQKIVNLWSYPSEARMLGIGGMVVIRMSLLDTGELERVQLVRSSGSGVLDDEARDAVKSAGPFHPFPEQITERKLIIEGYFRYMGGNSNPGGR